MPIELSPGDRQPVFLQIAGAVRAAVARGEFTPGDPLPTVRQLAADLGVHANTVLQAYRQLAADRVVTARRGSGTFVNRVALGTAERRVLADDVAERALRDTYAHGLTADDLTAALARRRLHAAPPPPGGA
ncbi:MAG TPA: GntR family transcriptional regulator [Gemmatimonadaceae bacterium]|nr:GntR family transcriptional regulator [Gemmatimonadaceae bacterium]